LSVRYFFGQRLGSMPEHFSFWILTIFLFLAIVDVAL
jgi:hypothetical protein